VIVAVSDEALQSEPGQGGGDDPFVSASVVADHGHWTVVVDVVFPDGVVRHRIRTYPTRARAEMAARIMQAAAERGHRPDRGSP